jgi:hypothetical protein
MDGGKEIALADAPGNVQGTIRQQYCSLSILNVFAFAVLINIFIIIPTIILFL